MRDTTRWGIVIGAVASAIAWIGQLLSSSKGVSLFPDLLSLLVLCAIARVGLRHVLRDAIDQGDVNRRVKALGMTAGVIISLSALARGLVLWSSPNAALVIISVCMSFLAILFIVNVIAAGVWKSGALAK